MMKKLFSNEKAVSPVIGVMLMIVITVILAAAVSSYAGGMKNQDTAPHATFRATVDVPDGVITIEHLGGDIVTLRNLKIGIESGFPSVTGYIDSGNITLTPEGDGFGPGEVATISFVTGTNNITFTGPDINQSVTFGNTLKLSMIDIESGQTIYITKVDVNQ